LGFKKEEQLGQLFKEKVATNSSMDMSQEMIQKGCDGEESHDVRMSLKTCFEGDLKVAMNVAPRRDGKKIIGTILIASVDDGDILMATLDKLGVSAWFTDLYGNVDTCNASAESLTGYSKEEQLGKTLTKNFVNEDTRVIAEAAISDALKGEDMYFGKEDISILTKSKENVPVNVNTGPRRRGGKVNGAIVMAMKGSGLLALLDHMNIPAWLTDREGKVDDVNESAVKLIEHEKEEQLGLVLADSFVVQTSQLTTTNVIKDAIGGAPMASLMMDMKTKNGLEVLVGADITKREERGKLVGSIVIARPEEGDILMMNLDKLGVAAWFTDTEGNIDECNKTAEVLVEYERAEQLGKVLASELVVTEAEKKATTAVDAALAGEHVHYGKKEVALLNKTQTPIPVHINTGPRRRSGKVNGTIVMAVKDESILDTLDQLGISAWLTDTDGKIDDANKTAIALVERSLQEQMGVGWVSDLVVEKGPAQSALQKAIDGDGFQGVDLNLLTKGGSEIPVDAHMGPREFRGRSLGSILMGVAKNTESQEFGMAMWETDLNGNIDACNQKACDMIEYAKEEQFGLLFAADKLMHQESQVIALPTVEGAVQGEEFENVGVKLVKKSGKVVIVNIDVFPRKSTKGVVNGTRIFARPIDMMDILDLMDRVGIPGWSTDSDANVDDCNKMAIKLLDFTKIEQVGKPLIEFVGNGFRVEVDAAVQSALEGGITLSP